MRAILLLMLLSVLAVPAFAQPVVGVGDAAAEADVREVVERFRVAIIRGDGAALRALFLPQPQTWITVTGDATLARRRANDPSAARLRSGSYEAFAAQLEKAAGREEEVFSNIDIRTDGAMAAVTFDFEYRVDGRAQNRGVEAWHLVKADTGWKIVSLVYSSHDPS